jgi:hypothetical protein
MWVDNDVPNWFPALKISTGHHFQNGHHKTAQIQHTSTQMIRSKCCNDMQFSTLW